MGTHQPTRARNPVVVAVAGGEAIGLTLALGFLGWHVKDFGLPVGLAVLVYAVSAGGITGNLAAMLYLLVRSGEEG